MAKVYLEKLTHAEGLDLPSYGTEDSAGIDLPAAVETSMVIGPMQRVLVPTGFKMALPKGYEAQLRPRSGLALKHGLTLLNTPGTIDADYRGEIKVLLVNLSTETFVLERGMRIAQMVIAQYTKADLQEGDISGDVTVRNAGGFGSTGV